MWNKLIPSLPNKKKAASILLLICLVTTYAPLWQGFFSLDWGNEAKKAEAASSQVRSKTVEFFIGQFTGDGTNGTSTGSVGHTLPSHSGSSTMRLMEDGVDIQQAYIEFEFQFAAYATAQTIYTMQSWFKTCVAPCSPVASSTGALQASSTATSMPLMIDSGESQTARFFIDVKDEAGLASYTGYASGTLAMQAHYRLCTDIFCADAAVNSIANASAKLVVTYTYDPNSVNLTNTVIYPLESTTPGDSGTQAAISTSTGSGCTFGTNCPSFRFNMLLPDYPTATSGTLSQWFYVGMAQRGTAATDQQLDAKISGFADSPDYIWENQQSANSGFYSWYITSSSQRTPIAGYTENTTSTLEVRLIGPTNNASILGGEVVETYAASSSASTKVKTVRYGVGAINTDEGVTTKVSNGVNVYLPETGVKIKKAWFRIHTTYPGGIGTSDLAVTTTVGGDSESSATNYAVGCSTQCVSEKFIIYHVVPSSGYATLEQASATSSINVNVSTDGTASTGPTSAELLITYTYTGTTNGYQESHSVFAGRTGLTANPFAVTSSIFSNIDPVLADTGGNLSVRAAVLDANYVISSTTVPVGSPTLGATMATGTCSYSNTYVTDSDSESARYMMYKDVASSMNTSDAQTYTTCYSTSLDSGFYSGLLVYTLQNSFPSFEQTGYHWRNDDDTDEFLVSSVDPSAGVWASMALSSSGLPIIAHSNSPSASLFLTKCGNADCSSGNTSSSLVTGGTAVTDVSLDLNSSGFPVIAYTTSGVSILVCGNETCTSGNTVNSVTSSDPGVLSMRLDTSNLPRIALGLGVNTSRIFFCGNTTCSSGNNEATTTQVFAGVSLRINSNNLPRLGVTSITSLQAGLFYCTTSTCTSGKQYIGVTPQSGNNSVHMTLKNSDEAPVIVYRNGSNLELMLCGEETCFFGPNTTTTIDTSVDDPVSIEVDNNDLPFVGYTGTNNTQLKLISCANQNCTQIGGKMNIDSSPSIDYPSLLLDSSNRPVIAYYGGAGRGLIFAHGYFASSKTSSTPNTTTTMNTGQSKRLRLQVVNRGATSTATQFQLQFATKSGGSCSASSGWGKVGASGGNEAFLMAASSNIEDATSTLDIPVRFGGIVNPTGTVPVMSNSALKDTSSTIDAITISSNELVEAEFSIVPTNAAKGTTYCFRLFDDSASSTLNTYTQYPEVQVVNDIPTVTSSSIYINDGAAITLNSNATKTVQVSFEVTDLDGCTEVFTSGFVTSTLFRSGEGGVCTADDLNCYRVATTTHNCTAGNTTANATATFQVYYYAEATDASSSFSSQNWLSYIQVKDSSASSSAATSTTGVELNTLLAMITTSSSLGYGIISPGSNTGATNTMAVVKNTGNSSSVLSIYGTALTAGTNSLATSSQHYATTSFTYGGNEQTLSNSVTTISGFKTYPTGWKRGVSAINVRERTAAVVYRSYLYGIGGVGALCGGTGVDSAPIQSDGSLGSWSVNTAIPYRWGHSAAVANDFLYVGGGNSGCLATPTSTVIYTSSTGSGTLNSWVTTASFPEGRRQYLMTSTGTYLYVLGGHASTTVGITTSSVIYTSSTANGTLNTWQQTTALPYTLLAGAAVVEGRWIYVIGGTANAAATTTVVRAEIQSNGSLGSWTNVQSLPSTLTNGGTNAVNVGGVIYLVGGTQNGAATSTVLYTQVNGDGSLGSWASSTAMLQSSRDHVAVYSTTTKTIYRLGGFVAGEAASTSSIFYVRADLQPLYWGISIPTGTKSGTYSGTTTFVPVYAP